MRGEEGEKEGGKGKGGREGEEEGEKGEEKRRREKNLNHTMYRAPFSVLFS